MKKMMLLLVLLLAIVAIIALRCRCPGPAARATKAAPSQPVAPAPVVQSLPEGQPPAARVAEAGPVVEETPLTREDEATESALPAADTPVLSPEQALETLRVTFKNYGQRFKGNPVGNNAEITAALNGDNPQQVRFLGETPKLNEKGELLDGWGTPYFFHQLSGYEMEIHSAGPDRKMWTADDQVAR